MLRLAVVGGVAVLGVGAGYAYWNKVGFLNKEWCDSKDQSVESIRDGNEESRDASNVVMLLGENASLLSEQELRLVDDLLREGQQHLFETWPGLGQHDSSKKDLVAQLARLDRSYPGGLAQYIKNAKRLLQESKAGINPFDGYTPAVPQGQKLDFASAHFQSFEAQGLTEAGRSAFVLVAGGLGERLGYSGIKLALPSENVSGSCFLKLYIQYILALQAASGTSHVLPLVIMTSDDTHKRTEQILSDNSNFGMAPDQITLLKQEKVPCLIDNDAHLAFDPSNRYAVQTKPHGHGDVHALLATSGLVDAWNKQGLKWVCFFQDTNALVFRALLAALGVSAARDFDMNSLAVPRKAKEAIGALSLLKHSNTSSLTINVEYNQLDPLLRATKHPDGDVNDETGYSPFPGNINQLVLKVDTYAKQLHKTGGIIAEFVNPKYKDASKTAFKSSTRLECMMQDYPKCLPSTAKVGFTLINQVWATYSPVKNSPADARDKAKSGNPTHSATTGELDIYKSNCLMLESLVGAKIPTPDQVEFNGISVDMYPRVVLTPLFAPTTTAVQTKISPGSLTVHPGSVLLLDGPDISIDGLEVSGALVLHAVPGARVLVKGLVVNNAGWSWKPIQNSAGAREEDAIRGFKVEKLETYELVFDKPGEYIIPEPPTEEEAAVLDGVASDVVKQLMGTPAPSTCLKEPEVPPSPVQPTVLFAPEASSTEPAASTEATTLQKAAKHKELSPNAAAFIPQKPAAQDTATLAGGSEEPSPKDAPSSASAAGTSASTDSADNAPAAAVEPTPAAPAPISAPTVGPTPEPTSTPDFVEASLAPAPAPTPADTTPARVDVAPAPTDATPPTADSTPAPADVAPPAAAMTLPHTDANPPAADAVPASTNAFPAGEDSTPAPCNTTLLPANAAPPPADITPNLTDATPPPEGSPHAPTTAVPPPADTIPAAVDTAPPPADAAPPAALSAPAEPVPVPATNGSQPAKASSSGPSAPTTQTTSEASSGEGHKKKKNKKKNKKK